MVSVQPNNTLGMGRAINSETLRQTMKERKAGGGRGSKRKQLEGYKKEIPFIYDIYSSTLELGSKNCCGLSMCLWSTESKRVAI